MSDDFSRKPTIPEGALAAVPQPTLPAGGLVLRPWEPADASVILAAFRDREIQRWHRPGPPTEELVREMFDRYHQEWTREAGAHWAVAREGGTVVGRIALRDMDLGDGTAECAYWVLPEARGARVASRALAAVSGWALDEVGFQRLELEHSTRNEASCRTAVGGGFALEGTKRSSAVHADGRHDMHLHARLGSGG